MCKTELHIIPGPSGRENIHRIVRLLEQSEANHKCLCLLPERDLYDFQREVFTGE